MGEGVRFGLMRESGLSWVGFFLQVLERLQKAQRLLKQSKAKDYYKVGVVVVVVFRRRTSGGIDGEG